MGDTENKEKGFESYTDFGKRFYGDLYSREGLKGWRRVMFREFLAILSFGRNPTDLKRVAACVMYHAAQLRVQLRTIEDELKEKGKEQPSQRGTQEFIDFRTSCLPLQGSIQMLSDEIVDMEALARSYLPLSLERR
jgi:hypothetical protein